MTSHASARADSGGGVNQSMVAFKSEGDVPLPVKIAKAILVIVSWAATIWWFQLWFRVPFHEFGTWMEKAWMKFMSSFWDEYAAVNYLLHVAPVIILAILALLYLELNERFPKRARCSTRPPSRIVRLYQAIWTQPLLVKTPIGILTLFDIVVFVVIMGTSAWIWGKYSASEFHTIDKDGPEEGYTAAALKWIWSCYITGLVLSFTIAMLFVPVARGSPILRLIDVPFEQAVRYHRWIGYLTVVVTIVHAVTGVGFFVDHHEAKELIHWPYTGLSNPAGMIAAVAGIIIGVTSLPYVRTHYFNTFFTVHHLYIIYYIFYIFHIQWAWTAPSMGPIFLFFIDRFLRMVQSRRQVTGVSARILPGGYVELRIPRPSGFKYSVLGFLYLGVPGISKLQWHPFSTSSSPLDDNNEVSILIKPLGDWTTSLHNSIAAKSATDAKLSGCPFAVKLQAEGPYGHESNYFLRYRTLILVAGGAGVTPYLAIIHDLLKRYQLQQEGLPTNVHVIWCVRRKVELATLRTIIPSHVYPGYGYQHSNVPAINIRAFVTGEAQMGGQDEVAMLEMSEAKARKVRILDSPQMGVGGHKGMSNINSYHNLWMIAVILASMTGFVLMSALFYRYVTAPKLQPEGKYYNSAMETLLHLISTFVGIVICGGTVVFFWGRSESKSRTASVSSPGRGSESKATDLEENDQSTLMDRCIVTEGGRPRLPEMFSEFAEKHEGEEVGVLVCGPETLQESVAAACRSRNFKGLMKTPFHYHSVSFDL